MKIVRDGDFFRCYVMISLEVDEARKLTEDGSKDNSRENMLQELETLGGNNVSSVTIPSGRITYQD